MEDKPARTPTRDLSARWWRQVGFWGLTLNVILGFPILVAGLWFKPGTDWGIMTALYPTLLAAWIGAAGIRQWGKNRGTEGIVDTAP